MQSLKGWYDLEILRTVNAEPRRGGIICNLSDWPAARTPTAAKLNICRWSNTRRRRRLRRKTTAAKDWKSHKKSLHLQRELYKFGPHTYVFNFGVIQFGPE
jgi:hypothetical protein